MFTVIEQLRTRLRRLGRRRQFEHDMHEELRLHIELRARDLVQAGHTPEEALRHARLEFGHVEAHKHSARRVLGLHTLDRLGVSWLDFKLGLRMLRRYPALSPQPKAHLLQEFVEIVPGDAIARCHEADPVAEAGLHPLERGGEGIGGGAVTPRS